MPRGEIGDETVEVRGPPGEAAEGEAVVDQPAAGWAAERLLLEGPHRGREEAGPAAQRGKAPRALPGPQARGDAGQRAAGAARAADHVERHRDLGRDLGAATRREGVAAALGQQVKVAKPVVQRGDDGRLGLPPVAGPVQVDQPHAAGRGRAQGRVEREVLLAADHADRGQPVPLTGRGRGADVVGIRTAECNECGVSPTPGRLQVECELPPLVARNLQADQVVPFQVQPDPGAGQPVVGDLRQRGREPDSHTDTLPAYR